MKCLTQFDNPPPPTPKHTYWSVLTHDKKPDIETNLKGQNNVKEVKMRLICLIAMLHFISKYFNAISLSFILSGTRDRSSEEERKNISTQFYTNFSHVKYYSFF